MDERAASLCRQIDEMRTMLNEMSTALVNGEPVDDIEILNLSRQMDDLIVKYSLLLIN